MGKQVNHMIRNKKRKKEKKKSTAVSPQKEKEVQKSFLNKLRHFCENPKRDEQFETMGFSQNYPDNL